MIWWAKQAKPQAAKANKPKRKQGIWYGDLTIAGPRIPFFQREKAAYIKLRRVGLSINQIAKAFGRSTSVIFRTTKNAESLNTLRRFDIRKLPNRIRRMSASLRYRLLMKLLPQWISWILEEVEEPP